ncbi:hypothetical protein [Brevibacterium sp. FME37]|uniref:hypothetical protein n=1 Tax=Brevibacterium sp. FME37 TaxID=2742607 RepID=UPI0018676DEF|nr:hypothetical protein [Brevibacterium sp. FME37]
MEKNLGEAKAASSPRPNEDECWAAFWDSVATMWLSLPLEIQQEYAAKYPRVQPDAPATS